MQNAAIDVLGLDWRYLAFEVHPDNLASAIKGAQAMRFIGLNLTVPHKLLAMDMLDALDDTARQWGAVNTVRFEAQDATGEWRPVREFASGQAQNVRACGFNTDADAIVQAISEDLGIHLRGASVLVLGAGGAGQVACLRLAAEGVERLHLVNRTVSKAEEVLTQIRTRYPAVKVALGYPKERVDLILNATSLGLRDGDPVPLDFSQFSFAQTQAVYDMIYRPAETRFLQAAKESGCRAANGLSMLLYQGAKALEIWTGLSAPVPVMREALSGAIYGK